MEKKKKKLNLSSLITQEERNIGEFEKLLDPPLMDETESFVIHTQIPSLGRANCIKCVAILISNDI